MNSIETAHAILRVAAKLQVCTLLGEMDGCISSWDAWIRSQVLTEGCVFQTVSNAHTNGRILYEHATLYRQHHGAPPGWLLSVSAVWDSIKNFRAVDWSPLTDPKAAV